MSDFESYYTSFFEAYGPLCSYKGTILQWISYLCNREDATNEIDETSTTPDFVLLVENKS